MKLLGIIIDKSLQREEHAKYVEGKIARGIGILCKARIYFNSVTLKTLYCHSCFHMYIIVLIYGQTTSMYTLIP